jgi:outer membrane protein OmpA-like peptidoglycan-associated protein
MVDPLNEGHPVGVPIIAEYEYQGVETYRDIPVHRISAQYAVRYQGPPPRADPGFRYFKNLQGRHTVEILLRVSDGLPLLMRDLVDETYTWPSGETVRFRGFTLTFGEGTVPLNPERVIASIGRTLNRGGASGGGNSGGPGNAEAAPEGPSRAAPGAGSLELSGNAGTAPGNPPGTGALGVEVATVPGGVRLTVKDIRFAADSEEFLPSEYPRLDRLAEALREAPDRNFLVEGHTAAVGRPQGELDLSIRRAKRMVEELVKRGIGADRFLYKGWGGTQALGDNATEAGRAQNRRVEITILE